MNAVMDARPGPSEVMVAVRGCGTCGSDLATHDWPADVEERFRRDTSVVPRVLGHESAGVVVPTGDGVRGLAEGERVALDTNSGCGTCALCCRGHFNICERLPRFGATRDGALAAYGVSCAHN